MVRILFPPAVSLLRTDSATGSKGRCNACPTSQRRNTEVRLTHRWRGLDYETCHKVIGKPKLTIILRSRSFVR